jgi:hypothetical protein
VEKWGSSTCPFSIRLMVARGPRAARRGGGAQRRGLPPRGRLRELGHARLLTGRGAANFSPALSRALVLGRSSPSHSIPLPPSGRAASPPMARPPFVPPSWSGFDINRQFGGCAARAGRLGLTRRSGPEPRPSSPLPAYPVPLHERPGPRSGSSPSPCRRCAIGRVRATFAVR